MTSVFDKPNIAHRIPWYRG